MKVRVRTQAEDRMRNAMVVRGSGDEPTLVIEGTPFPPHDRRLREIEVTSATDAERQALKRRGYRIFGL